MLSKRAHNFDVDLEYLHTYSVDRALRDPYDAIANPNVRICWNVKCDTFYSLTISVH